MCDVVSPSFIRSLLPDGGEQQGWGPPESIVIIINGEDHYLGTIATNHAEQFSVSGSVDANKRAKRGGENHGGPSRFLRHLFSLDQKSLSLSTHDLLSQSLIPGKAAALFAEHC